MEGLRSSASPEAPWSGEPPGSDLLWKRRHWGGLAAGDSHSLELGPGRQWTEGPANCVHASGPATSACFQELGVSGKPVP